jgi:hypothetical protein
MVAVVWSAAAAMSLLAPDLVTGSTHEHLPMAALTTWVWAAAATVFLCLPRSFRLQRRVALRVDVTWLVAAVLVARTPDLVTGTGTTEIPVAALVVPVLAALVTGYVVLGAVVGARDHHDR